MINVSLKDIEEARKTIQGVASRTPLVYSPTLSGKTGLEVYMKLENFQPTKAFKLRGATNKMKQLPKGSLVVTASSGNHGFAVSYAAWCLGQKAIVCVPETANPDKINNIRSFGAEVVARGASYEEAYKGARQIESERGAIFVHAYEDPYTIAGQGTVGLEILEDLPQVDTVLVPVGGGGLISGISIALHNAKKEARVIGVQSSNAATMVHAFQTGELSAPRFEKTVCDGLVTKIASQIVLEIMRENVAQMLAVPDDEIIEAVYNLLRWEHLLVEPSGAATTAAVLSAKTKAELGKRVVVVVSGGNISIDFLAGVMKDRTPPG
jgi:threonine dehydratase